MQAFGQVASFPRTRNRNRTILELSGYRCVICEVLVLCSRPISYYYCFQLEVPPLRGNTIPANFPFITNRLRCRVEAILLAEKVVRL